MSISIRFRLRMSKKKVAEDAYCSLYCHVSVNAERDQSFSTGLKLRPSRWNVMKQAIDGKPDALEKTIMDSVNNTRAELTRFFTDLKMQKRQFSTAEFLNLYGRQFEDFETVVQLWNRWMLKQFEEQNLEDITKNKYRYA